MLRAWASSISALAASLKSLAKWRYSGVYNGIHVDASLNSTNSLAKFVLMPQRYQVGHELISVQGNVPAATQI